MKDQEDIVQLILDRYLLCPQIKDYTCDLWWKHDDCLVLWQLLYEINPKIYPKPPVEDNWHIKKMDLMKASIQKVMYENAELFDKLGSDYDENGIPYWEKND